MYNNVIRTYKGGITIIDLHIKIFNLRFNLFIKYDKRCKDETPIKDISNSYQNAEEYEHNEIVDFDDFSDEELSTFISEQAKVFEADLRNSDGIYNIPSYSDIPPRHNIQDDVEIITERFEREVEDIYEGRR